MDTARNWHSPHEQLRDAWRDRLPVVSPGWSLKARVLSARRLLFVATTIYIGITSRLRSMASLLVSEGFWSGARCVTRTSTIERRFRAGGLPTSKFPLRSRALPRGNRCCGWKSRIASRLTAVAADGDTASRARRTCVTSLCTCAALQPAARRR